MSDRPDYWTSWAADAKRTGSALYERLAQGTGGDETLKVLAAHARKGQPHANILLASVHFLLLRGYAPDHPLRRYYATLGGNACLDDGDPFPLFQDFVARHRDAILPLVQSRVTNTNEVGRSALLHAGFRAAASAAGEPLSLIEVGPSAGLNLLWDRYGVRYLKDAVVAASIAPNATLVLDTELRGDRLPPFGPTPRVARRVGLELNPVELSNEDDRDWLRALVWPDEAARMERLVGALALFDPASIEIRQGDALSLLSDAIAEVPRNEAICVFHTIATYQFSREMKEALENILIVAGLRRRIFRLAFEHGKGELGKGEYLLSLIHYEDGSREEQTLASSHPHGRWIEWRA